MGLYGLYSVIYIWLYGFIHHLLGGMHIQVWSQIWWAVAVLLGAALSASARWPVRAAASRRHGTSTVSRLCSLDSLGPSVVEQKSRGLVLLWFIMIYLVFFCFRSGMHLFLNPLLISLCPLVPWFRWIDADRRLRYLGVELRSSRTTSSQCSDPAGGKGGKRDREGSTLMGRWPVNFVEGRDHRYHRSYRQIMSDLSQIYPGRFFRTIFRFRVSRCWSLRGIPWRQESEEALRALQIMKHRAPAAGTGETWRDMAKKNEKKLNVHHTSHRDTKDIVSAGLEALQQVNPCI